MTAQRTLQTKRDTESKLQTSGKTEKLPQVQAEIQEVGVVIACGRVIFVLSVGEEGERGRREF